MKLYILMFWDYDDSEVVGIFTTKAKADHARRSIIVKDMKKAREKKFADYKAFGKAAATCYAVEEFEADKL